MVEELEKLRQLVPPPASPIGAKGDWEKVQADLGLELPDDYKDFISLYGAGTISGMISIGNPFIQPVTARRFWENWADIYRDISEHHTDVPYDLYPDCPGLLPCGDYADVNIINWLTATKPGTWRLVFFAPARGFFDLGTISLTRFLLDLLTDSTDLPGGTISSEILLEKPREFVAGYSLG